MDEDIKQALAAIQSDIRDIKSALAKGTQVPPWRHVEQLAQHGADQEHWKSFIDPATLTFRENYWEEGYVGAEKGVNQGLYSVAVMMLTMQGLDPKYAHMRIVRLMSPQTENWTAALITPADLGWVDGTGFVVDPAIVGGAAYQRWVRYGCPSADADGFLVVGGTWSYNQQGKKVMKGDQSEFVVSR